MYKRGIAPIIILLIIAAIAACAAAAVYLISKKSGVTNPPVFCTMEAKLCPDGSYVGRSGPKCEFAACPSPAPDTNKTCDGANDGSCPLGYQCIQDCGPPVVQQDSPPPPYRCIPDAEARKPRMCPICLASNTEIDTPQGPVNVKDIKVGMHVWSMDARGQKISSVVKMVTRTPVPKSHRVVHLVLSDGREVWVSPGHPTIGGSPVGALTASASYDGASVQSVNLVPYGDEATYDLLPDSPSGAYWANGIRLGSTLH